VSTSAAAAIAAGHNRHPAATANNHDARARRLLPFGPDISESLHIAGADPRGTATNDRQRAQTAAESCTAAKPAAIKVGTASARKEDIAKQAPAFSVHRFKRRVFA
jgi:hypothetical protein